MVKYISVLLRLLLHRRREPMHLHLHQARRCHHSRSWSDNNNRLHYLHFGLEEKL